MALPISEVKALPGARLFHKGAHASWLKARRSGIGGSDVAALLGLSPWATPFTLWESKVMEPKPITSEAMTWGTVLEEPIAEEWARRHHFSLVRCPEGTIFQSKKYPLALASPDALTEKLDAWVEIKAVGAHASSDWTDDEIPPYYYAQAQWEAFVSGLDTVYVAALIGGQTLRSYVVPADNKWATETYEKAEEFWNTYVTTRIAPPVDDTEATKKALSSIYPPVPETVVEGGQELGMLIAEYNDAIDLEKRAKSQKTLAQNKILALLGGASIGTIDDIPVVKYATVHKESYTVPASDYPRLTLVKQGKA
ncbi:MAG: YqaJ viral recombinase family protein [Candidatus Parvarchaeum sp.]